MQNKLFFYTLTGIIFTILIGTLSHFFYEWSRYNPYIGLVVPVNESVWEHIKIIFFPMFLFCSVENILLQKEYPRIYKANACAIYTGAFSIPVIFFTYTGILGKNYLACDIAVFCLRCSCLLLRLQTGKKRPSLVLQNKKQNRCLLLCSGLASFPLFCPIHSISAYEYRALPNALNHYAPCSLKQLHPLHFLHAALKSPLLLPG